MQKYWQLFFHETSSVLIKSSKLFLELLKVLVPVTILVKILSEIGFVTILGKWLMPLMNLVGLPGEMGLVWATGLISSPYAAIFAYIAISETVPISIAQITVLSSMLLIAHNLIIEVSIGKKIGVSVRYQIVLRVLAAFAFGMILNFFYQKFNLLTELPLSIWAKDDSSTSLLAWGLSSIKNYLTIFLVMTGLIGLMRLMEKTHLLEKLYSLSEPILKFFGMSKKAAPIAIIGMTLGLSVGGGLIIDEAKSGNLSKKDIFLVLTSMSLLHSLIEDTLIMTTIGAHLSGILFGRLLFTFVAFYGISRSKFIERLFFAEI
jgi:hypothetical protein